MAIFNILTPFPWNIGQTVGIRVANQSRYQSTCQWFGSGVPTSGPVSSNDIGIGKWLQVSGSLSSVYQIGNGDSQPSPATNEGIQQYYSTGMLPPYGIESAFFSMTGDGFATQNSTLTPGEIYYSNGHYYCSLVSDYYQEYGYLITLLWKPTARMYLAGWRSDGSSQPYSNSGIELHEVIFAGPPKATASAHLIGAPEKADSPNPESGQSGVAVDMALVWNDGGRETDHPAKKYSVYAGLTPSTLTKRGEIEHPSAGLPFMADQLRIPLGLKLYWRIDAENDSGITTGDVWNCAVVLPDVPARPDDYDPDTPYDPTTHDWNPAATVGGGRYSERLIAIGHECIYYS